MATYTPAQLDRYYKRINLQPSSDSTPSLDNLSRLLTHQLAAVPFENLSLHYSQSHLLSLDPEDLFVKIVEHQRGGYCMENNTFFGAVLRSLGYELINAGARVSRSFEYRNDDGFGGW
jgi:arylamine N-acetyltransferase